MKRTSPQFQKLQAQWYQKLKESGFEDIEDTEKDTLKCFSFQRTSPSSFNRPCDETQYRGGSRSKAAYEYEVARRAGNIEYYRAALAITHTETFMEMSERFPHHREIWAMHCEGVCYRKIALKFGMHINGIKWIVNKYRPLMKGGS